MIDQSEIGSVVGEMMDDLEKNVADGTLPDGCKVTRAAVIVEVVHDNPDTDDADRRHVSFVTLGMSENSNVIALGLIDRARHAILFADD